jgi:hypothetical protein
MNDRCEESWGLVCRVYVCPSFPTTPGQSRPSCQPPAQQTSLGIGDPHHAIVRSLAHEGGRPERRGVVTDGGFCFLADSSV